MTARMTRREAWAYFEGPLTNAIAVERGEMACIDSSTGLLDKGKVSTTLIPIGYFEEDGTGDGTTNFRVRLFKELSLHWWDNDSGTPVVAADLGSLCYILDDRTVSGDSTARSVAGRVWAINATLGVLVAMVDDDTGLPASFASGEYVPTLTDVTNVAASVLVAARYVRINNTVIVYFAATIDITGAGAAELGVDLPVASALAAAGDLTGHANTEVVGEDQAVIAGDVANDRAAVTYTGIGTGVIAWAGSFSYQVL